MKKTHLLLLLALSFCMMDGVFAQQTQTKEYYPLIPANGEKQWDVRVDFIWGDTEYHVARFGEEIELDGLLYRKMMYAQDHTDMGLMGALREENKKVYVRWWQSGLQHFNEEQLYYDFNLQVGDWFMVSEVETLSYVQLEAIEEVVMEDGSVRNKYIFNDGWGEDKEVWIEGIGSLAGVHRRFNPDMISSSFSYLQCYFEENDLVWTDGECWDITDETAVETFSAHPNPTEGVVNIEAKNLLKVVVLNTMGQSILTSDQSQIDLSGIPSGVYFLRICDGEGRVRVQKIIKE